MLELNEKQFVLILKGGESEYNTKKKIISQFILQRVAQIFKEFVDVIINKLCNGLPTEIDVDYKIILFHLHDKRQ